MSSLLLPTLAMDLQYGFLNMIMLAILDACKMVQCNFKSNIALPTVQDMDVWLILVIHLAT